MSQDREAKEQVPCSARDDGGREAMEIAVNWRYMRVLQVVAVGIKSCCAAQITAVADENVVKPFVL